MKTGIVKHSYKPQSSLRFDASFHLSDGLVVKRLVAASPYEMLTIKDVTEDIFYGNRAKRVYVKKRNHGIPFLTTYSEEGMDFDFTFWHNWKLRFRECETCSEARF